MQNLDIFVRKLASQNELGEEDVRAIVALPWSFQSLAPLSWILREGAPPDRCAILLSGFAFRHKIALDGMRQIVGVHVPGDPLDFQTLFLDVVDHNAQTLTRCDVAFIPCAVLRRLFHAHPNVAQAIYANAITEASVSREWLLNIGRRQAPQRLCHLLCELATRLHQIGLAKDHMFTLPMTQEQLGDALGLTAVHVNRTLKLLEREGLIERDRRFVVLKDWPRLREFSGFSARYLHLGRQKELVTLAVDQASVPTMA